MMDEDHASTRVYEEIDLNPSGVTFLSGSSVHGVARRDPVGVVGATYPMPLPRSAPPIPCVYLTIYVHIGSIIVAYEPRKSG